MPSKQIHVIGRTITYNGATCSFKLKVWRHTILWTAPCSSWCTVLDTSAYAKLPCNNLRWSITQNFFTSDIHSAWGSASQTPRVHSTRGVQCIVRQAWVGCMKHYSVYIVMERLLKFLFSSTNVQVSYWLVYILLRCVLATPTLSGTWCYEYH